MLVVRLLRVLRIFRVLLALAGRIASTDLALRCVAEDLRLSAHDFDPDYDLCRAAVRH